MLGPDERTLLLDALRPPPGYELGRALATSFTLDLTAALAVPLAMAARRVSSVTDPLAVMEAVRSSADRVDIFCQAGNISLPATASDLTAFLEPVVHPVRRPKPGHLFHPKLWVLRFDDPDGWEPSRFRVLVPTRNLTFDRGWDLLLRLDDNGERRRNRGNDHLRRLLEYLPDACAGGLDDSRAAAVEELADELRTVQWALPDHVDEARFWVLGIGRPRLDFAGYRHLVVAPFLNEHGLDVVLGESTHDVTVVSREASFDQLEPATVEWLGGDLRTVDVPLAADADDSGLLDGAGASDPGASGGAELAHAAPGRVGDLHAKCVVVERNRRAHVFVGSANVTQAAFGGNIEVLCELEGRVKHLGVAAALDEAEGLGSVLVRYRAEGGAEPSAAERLEEALEERLRRLAEVVPDAHVTPTGDGRYVVRVVAAEAFEADLDELALAPVNRPREQLSVAGGVLDVSFGPRPIEDLTAFYVLSGALTDGTVTVRGSTVVSARLHGVPDRRLDAIIARQVDSPEKFLRWVLLLLGIGPGALASAGESGGAAFDGPFGAGGAGVLEHLLEALARRPEAVDDLADLVARLEATETGRAVLPERWEQVWPVVVEARAALESHR